MPAPRSGVPGRAHAANAQITWKTATEAKNKPAGIQSRQCDGMTARWITAAPIDAIAASRAASALSVPVSAL
jgi:hypothetical protein